MITTIAEVAAGIIIAVVVIVALPDPTRWTKSDARGGKTTFQRRRVDPGDFENRGQQMPPNAPKPAELESMPAPPPPKRFGAGGGGR